MEVAMSCEEKTVNLHKERKKYSCKMAGDMKEAATAAEYNHFPALF